MPKDQPVEQVQGREVPSNEQTATATPERSDGLHGALP